MISIAIFASGSGTNAEEFFSYFGEHSQIRVKSLYSNNANAFVLQRAKNHGVASHVFNRESFYQSEQVMDQLHKESIDFIVLAGFMWLIPDELVRRYRDRIVNIHPALLPKYGGKGMYGDHVHKAVIASGDRESGITIHLVNEKYDEGRILFQATCPVSSSDDAESLAQKVHALEYAHYPVEVEQYILKVHQS